ncbi:hypothetical protein FQN54_007096 [Arachnomyces sp. PD_36]|nr:hypothetical protein FQN54_007096 [Arachnomyces sp. PD_36]
MATTARFELPPGFLPPTIPEGASMRRIDFANTDPPIPEYKNLFAVMIDNLFTELECQGLIRAAETSTFTPTNTTPSWDRALINIGGGEQMLAVDSRNCGRIIFDTPLIAQKIQDRLAPFLKECDICTIRNQPLVTGLGPVKRNEVLHLSRLNERLRFLRYDGGEYFRPHCDGNYVTPSGDEQSLYTIHLYLNGDGEQDLEELQAEKRKRNPEGHTNLIDLWDSMRTEGEKEAKERKSDPSEPLLGGATSFHPNFQDEGSVRVFPKTGSVLIFQQRGLCHAGDDVFRGRKYTMRTDMMYRKKTE